MARFVPRQRKRKVLERQRAQQQNGITKDVVAQPDSNIQEILPAELKEREEKKARMREELRGGVKVSSKKAKRLEKYIDTKLKKDENRQLLGKLAATRIDTSLFASSRNLGQTKSTRKEAVRRAILERKAGLAVHESSNETDDDEELVRSDSEGYGVDEKASSEAGLHVGQQQPSVSRDSTSAIQQPSQPVVSTGSGLKRPLEVDNAGNPVLRKRRKRGGVKSKLHLQPIPEQDSASDSGDEWGGFSDIPVSESEAESEQMEQQDVNGMRSSPGDEDSESGTDSDEDNDDNDDNDDDNDKTEVSRPSAFKAWAHRQRNEALGYESAGLVSNVLDIPKPALYQPRTMEQDPLPLELQQTSNVDRKAYSVAIARIPEIDAARLALPIISEEQRIIEAIHSHDVTVISGSTGSGKTTQVPQFLFENGYGSPGSPTPGMIGVTQPRRVAAVSMSKRVATELGDYGSVVGYQIRFEGTTDKRTAIKFMTDGVLLREVANDLALRKYSVIVVDEAHERSVNTDVLIGILSRVNRVRYELTEKEPSIKPLKLVIMSATLRLEDVTQNHTLFPIPPPVIEVEGRQYPVTIHFSRKTRHDYIEEAFQKVSKGHRKLPPGGILVFLTGQNEITQLLRRLKMAFGGMTSVAGPKVRIPASEAPFEAEDVDFGEFDYSGESDESDAGGDGDEEAEFMIEDEEPGTGPLKMNILPLYSLLSTREQQKVFDPPPDGYRQVILATNVAETSLTIPGIRYVFDCGRAKERKYNHTNGVQSFEIDWISKASANQRAGRAGRTGPGHCYRLYSSAVYERDFAEFAKPELLRTPIEGVVLQLKAMNVPNVAKFPFPTPPDRQTLLKAEKLLQYLAALEQGGQQVTTIGLTMSIFPLSPRFAKILLVGHQLDCIAYTIAMVAGLSTGEVFIPPDRAIPAICTEQQGDFRSNEDIRAEDERAKVSQAYNAAHRTFCSLDDKSDAVKLLQVVGEFAHEPTEEWCEKHFVRFKALREIQQLRRQIVDLLRTNIPLFANLSFKDKLDRPTGDQVTLLKQMAAAGFIDQVAIRADKAPYPPEMSRKPSRAIDVPYLPLMPLEVGSQGDDVDKLVYIHPASPLAHLSAVECPEYVVYAYLQRGAAAGAEGERKAKSRMHALTDVTGRQLASLAKGTPLISYGKPIKEVINPEDNKVRECWVVPYLRAEGTGGMGWPLPVKKIKQRRVAGKGWVDE